MRIVLYLVELIIIFGAAILIYFWCDRKIKAVESIYEKKISDFEKSQIHHLKQFARFTKDLETCNQEREYLVKQLWVLHPPKRQYYETLVRQIKIRTEEYGIGGFKDGEEEGNTRQRDFSQRVQKALLLPENI